MCQTHCPSNLGSFCHFYTKFFNVFHFLHAKCTFFLIRCFNFKVFCLHFAIYISLTGFQKDGFSINIFVPNFLSTGCTSEAHVLKKWDSFLNGIGGHCQGPNYGRALGTQARALNFGGPKLNF